MTAFRPSLALVSVVVLAATADPVHSQGPPYVQRMVDVNRVGLTITNYGLVGNNFVSRSPSLEIPLGTGYEHLVTGGLWIGARAIDDAGAFHGVTTACLDISQGAATFSATEFTPATSFQLRSRDPGSAFYDPDALSDEDAVSRFDDLVVKRATGNPQDHRPLRLEVRQEVYAWNAPDYEDIVFLRYVIRNLGPPLGDVWVGHYDQFASGPKNAYSTWPPTSGGSVHGSWYGKKLLGYDPSLRLLREHRCDGTPAPSNCHFEVTPYWAGIKLLTPPAAEQNVTVAAWRWSPNDPARDQDVERYAIMSAGTIQDLTVPDLIPVTGDPAELLALGPFASLESGDSIEVHFALLGGAEVEDIQRNASAAQDLHDDGYRIDPTPTSLAFVRSSASSGRVEVVWDGRSVASLRPTVYRRETTSGWTARGTIAADGAGLLRFDDPRVTAGSRYGYRLGFRSGPGEAERYAGETWVDVPASTGFALAAARSPTSSSEIALRLSLPVAGPVAIEVVDLSGRISARRDGGALQAGEHVLRLELETGLAPGIYYARLRQGARTAHARIVITGP